MACLHVGRNVPAVHIACLSLSFVIFWFPWLVSVTAAVGVGLCRVERLATLSQFIKVIILGDFHNDLAKTAKEVGSHLERNAMTWWRIGDEGMVEWSERKGDCCESIVSLDVIGRVLTLTGR